MEHHELYENILSGNCILFTGAGFSHGARNINNTKLLNGSELAKKLNIACGIEDEVTNLRVASELFIDEHGDFSLIELLRSILS